MARCIGCHTSLLSFNRLVPQPFLQCHWAFLKRTGHVLCRSWLHFISDCFLRDYNQLPLLIRIGSLIFGRISTSVLLDPSQSTTFRGCDAGSSHCWWSRNCHPAWTFPAGQWVKILPFQFMGAQVWSLVGELQEPTCHTVAKPPPKPKLQSFLFLVVISIF